MTSRDLWVPLSVRRKVHDAIRDVKPVGTTKEWAQAEAAIDALVPWILGLLDTPESAVTKPTNNSDSLEDRRA